MGFPFIKGFASISKRLVASEAAQGRLRLPKWSAEQGRPIQKGLLASPSHHDRLRLQLDDVHRQLTYTREIADFYHTHFGASTSVPGQPGDLQARCAQLSIAIEESLSIASYHLRGPSPTSHRVSSPDAAPLGPHSATLRGSLSRQA